VAIPYEDTTLPGYFYRAEGDPGVPLPARKAALAWRGVGAPTSPPMLIPHSQPVLERRRAAIRLGSAPGTVRAKSTTGLGRTSSRRDRRQDRPTAICRRSAHVLPGRFGAQPPFQVRDVAGFGARGGDAFQGAAAGAERGYNVLSFDGGGTA